MDSIALEFEPIGKPFDVLYADLAKAREAQPIFHWAQQDVWVVTRHQDVVDVLMDGEHFTVHGILEMMNNAYTPEARELLASTIDFNRTPHIQNSEGSEHQRMRQALTRILTPQRFKRMEPDIRALANRLIDGFEAQGRCEFVSAFAYPLPILVVFHLIGFVAAEHDMEKLQTWSDDLFSLWLAPLPAEDQVRCARSVVEYFTYMQAQMADRRRAPRDDLMSELLAAVDAGESRLTDSEIVLMFTMNLIGAGHETTKSALANGVYQLLREPDRWAQIRADPSSLPSVVEEIMRYDSSVLCWYRTVAEDVTFKGVALPKGSRILVALGAANHDAAKYDNAESFCPRGERNGQLAFSTGRHLCPGAPLARAEMRIAFEEMSRRLPGLRLASDAPIAYLPSVATRTLLRLDVEWDQTSA